MISFLWLPALRAAFLFCFCSLVFTSLLYAQEEEQVFGCSPCATYGGTIITYIEHDTIVLPDFPSCSVVVGFTVYKCATLIIDLVPMGPYEKLLGDCDSLKKWLATNPDPGYSLNSERLRWLEDYTTGQYMVHYVAKDPDRNQYLCPPNDSLDCWDASLASFRINRKNCVRFMAPIEVPAPAFAPSYVRRVRNCGQGCCVTKFRACWDAATQLPVIRYCGREEHTDIGCNGTISSPLPPGYRWVSSCFNSCLQREYYYQGPARD